MRPRPTAHGLLTIRARCARLVTGTSVAVSAFIPPKIWARSVMVEQLSPLIANWPGAYASCGSMAGVTNRSRRRSTGGTHVWINCRPPSYVSSCVIWMIGICYAASGQLSRFVPGRKLVLPPDEPGHVYHLYVIKSDQRDALRQYLTLAGIGTDIHYPVPVHLQPAYAYLGYLPTCYHKPASKLTASSRSQSTRNEPEPRLNRWQQQYGPMGTDTQNGSTPHSANASAKRSMSCVVRNFSTRDRSNIRLASPGRIVRSRYWRK